MSTTRKPMLLWMLPAWLPWAALAVLWSLPSPAAPIGPWSRAVNVAPDVLELHGEGAWRVDLVARRWSLVEPRPFVPMQASATCLRVQDGALVDEPGAPLSSACRPPMWVATPVPLSALDGDHAPAIPWWLIVLLAPLPAMIVLRRAWWPGVIMGASLGWIGVAANVTGRMTRRVERPLHGEVVINTSTVMRSSPHEAWLLEHDREPVARWVPLPGERTLGACLTTSGASWWIRGPWDGRTWVSRLDYRRTAVSVPVDDVTAFACEGEVLHLATRAGLRRVAVDGRIDHMDGPAPSGTWPDAACVALTSATPVPASTCDPEPGVVWPLVNEPVDVRAGARIEDVAASVGLGWLALLPLPLTLIIRRRSRRR